MPSNDREGRQLSNPGATVQANKSRGRLCFRRCSGEFCGHLSPADGAPVALTALEFKLLKYMIHNKRRALPRDELLNRVWGYQNYPRTRTVDNLISMPPTMRELEGTPRAKPVNYTIKSHELSTPAAPARHSYF